MALILLSHQTAMKRLLAHVVNISTVVEHQPFHRNEDLIRSTPFRPSIHQTGYLREATVFTRPRPSDTLPMSGTELSRP